MSGDWDLPASMYETGLLGGSRGLYHELKQGFAASGVILRREGENDARLRILEEHLDKRILSVDAIGKVLEYELSYTLEFDVIGADSKAMLQPQRLYLVRDYLYVGDDVYGTSRQEKLLREQMRREMADLILWRIQAQAR